MMVGNYENGVHILKKMYKENQGRPEDTLMTAEEENELINRHIKQAVQNTETPESEEIHAGQVKDLFIPNTDIPKPLQVSTERP